MSNSISLSKGIRSNLLQLQNIAGLTAQTQNRLATGKKVNSALDNASNFFTASALNSRASDMSNLLDGLSNGVKTLEAADNGLTSITKTVEQMQATLRQARQDKSFKGQSLSLDATAIGTASAKNLTLSGGAVGTTPVNIALNSTASGTQSTVAASSAYSAPTAASSGVFTGTANFAATTITDAADSITFKIAVDGGSATSVTISQTTLAAVGNGDGVLDSVAEFGELLTNAGINNVTVANVGGKLQIKSNSTGTSSSIAISNYVKTDANSNTTDNSTIGAGASTGGADATTRAITISNGTGTANITLNNLNAGTAADARAYIQQQLAAQNVTGITVGGSGSNIDLSGLADGTNSITVGGTGANSVFGAGRTVTPGVAAGRAKTVDELVASINGNASLTGKVTATNDGGKLRIENQSTAALTVVGSTAAGVVNGGTGNSNTTTIGGNDVRKSLVSQFNELKTQLDKLADDAGINGVNLLKGNKLKLSFNEKGTSSIEIQAKDTNGNVREISAANLGITNATNDEFSSDDSLDTRLSTLSDALTTLRSQASAFGSNLSIVQNRTEFTKSMINTLKGGADNLTLADQNEEAANLLSLQTRQQLAQTALSLANQADQGVLRLF